MRGLLISVICLLTLYGPAELTRVIIAWGLSGKLIFELAFMWLFYVIAMLVISAALARRPLFTR